MLPLRLPGPRDNHHDCFVFRRSNRHLKREAFPLFFSRSMVFFLDHRSTKLIIPESYDRSICSSCTFNPALPLSPVRRHSVLYGHSKQGAGVCLKPSSPRGNTISSFPKQSNGLSLSWVIGFWSLGTGYWLLVADYLSLVHCHSLLATRHLSLVTGHWIFDVVIRSSRCLLFL